VTRMYRSRALIFAVSWGIPLGLAVIATTPAVAQIGMSNRNGMTEGSKQNLKSLDKGGRPVQAPPSLPGTKAPVEAAAPTTSPTDMSPTDALFDAINRGDTAAARDAVNRGADMRGVNVLGLTPLELSVDLGRNDISFLLLSMRDGDSSSRSAKRMGAGAGGPGGTGQADAVLRGGSAPRPRARVATASSGAEEPVSEQPRLFSGNGGTPIPASGFVGFDPGRAVR
jgi:hypothetical protein